MMDYRQTIMSIESAASIAEASNLMTAFAIGGTVDAVQLEAVCNAFRARLKHMQSQDRLNLARWRQVVGFAVSGESRDLRRPPDDAMGR